MDAAAVLAHRLVAWHLDARLPAGSEALAAAGGLRDSPVGAARDALAARVEGVPDLSGLLLVWGPRAAPHRIAAADLAVFTRGARPADEESARAQAGGATDHLDAAGVEVLDALAQVEAAMAAAVADGPVGRDALHERLRGALPGGLLWWCRGCGSHHVHPQLWRMAGQAGGVRRDHEATSRAVTFAAVADPPPPGDARADAAARAELTRRLLHHHGPLTARELQAQLALSRADADGRLATLAGELDEVDRAGTAALALAADRDALAGPPPPLRGTRLLPVGDGLLDGRDRRSVLPDDADRTAVLGASIGGPGAVLRDGAIVGTWRAKAARRRLVVTLAPLPSGSARALGPAREALAEAEALAAARGLAGAELG